MGDEKTSRGLVVLVGAGPGEASLITLAGAKWLSRADTVVYDRLIAPDLLKLCRGGAELVYVGKASAGGAGSQEQINALLVDRCLAGRLVVRLKGGDPFVFGRGGEEADALAAAGLDFRVVPGVTAGVAGPAFAGIPVTDRRAAAAVAFVTGHGDPDALHSDIDWEALARIHTVVFYMGVGNLAKIAGRLVSAGRAGETPVAVVQRGAGPAQRTVVATLETIADAADAAGVAPPALVVVGDVVNMRSRLAWFEKLPLFGRTVLVTRSRRQASRLAEKLAELGAEVIEAPTIEIHPPADPGALDDAVGRIGEFDWLVLTSPNGAEAFFDRLGAVGLDARALGGVKVAAVGAATAEAVRQRGVQADLVPDAFTTEALGEALAGRLAPDGGRVLLARTDIAPPALADALVAAGADVQEVTAYRTVRPAALDERAAAALAEGRVDWITFTSSATVENFLALAPQADLAQVKLAAIGPVTAEALKRRGLAAHVVAAPHTIDALSAGIAAFEADR